jgi:D-lactate dehydrogenase (cytochrome)
MPQRFKEQSMMPEQEFLDACRQAIGAPYLLCEAEQMAPFLTEWRKRHSGQACAVARPGSTEEVAQLVKLCQRHRVPIVPQGGNTGLVLGSIPVAGPPGEKLPLLISLLRQNRVRAVDAVNQTITVEAGCLLAEVQQAASSAGRFFPLSLGSEGSCSIGGNLSSNAGGTGVLRYGNTRELCLGLEVVCADGQIWHGLRALRKDNTGYDLRDLFIGSEGTLGIICAAVMKLFPQPKAQLTALVALDSVDSALKLLNLAQAIAGPVLTAFELMSALCLRMVMQEFPQLMPSMAAPPASGAAPSGPVPASQYVLLELSDHEDESHTSKLLEALTEAAFEQNLIIDAVLASSIKQSQQIWSLREHIPLAQAADGKNIKHDISLPISSIAHFIDETEAQLQQAFPACRVVCFGHIGDGNLHFNVASPPGVKPDDFLSNQSAINHIVHQTVQRFQGSISAEHGIGALKQAELLHYKSALEIRMMQQIKQALDPANIMNPGKILARMANPASPALPASLAKSAQPNDQI